MRPVARPAVLTAARSARPAASSVFFQANDDKSASSRPSDSDRECVISSATRDGILMQFSKWNRKCEACRQVNGEEDKTYITMMAVTEASQGGREARILVMVGDRNARHSGTIPDKSMGQDDDDASQETTGDLDVLEVLERLKVNRNLTCSQVRTVIKIHHV
jgi:hypothetical protein